MVRAHMVAVRLGLCLAAWLIASTGLAQSRVVVLDFDGPRAGRLRAQVVTALAEEGVEFVAKAEAEATAREERVKLDTPDGRVAVARVLNVSAFVDGTADKKGSRVTLTVRVYNGADGEQLGEADIRGKNRQVRKRVQKNLWGKVGEWISGASAPEPEEEPEPEPMADAEDREPVEDEDDGERAGAAIDAEYDMDDVPKPSGDLHALDFGLGLRFVSRSFDYKDPVLELANYSIPPNPALYAHAHWYPGAHFSQGPAAWIGLDLAFTLLLAPDTERDGQTYETSARDYRLGLRFRVPFGEHEVALAAGYAAQRFVVDDAGDGTPSGLPGANYGMIRVGPEARFGFASAFAVEVEVAYLHPIKFGHLGADNWFPNVSGMGIDAGLRVAWAPVKVLEVFAGGTLRQIGLTFDPKEDDEGVLLGRAAGGATDRYIGPELGVRLRI